MANDINSDPNGQAQWRFENGLFLLDETAKNNDLTNVGVATIAGGAQLEGNQSADFEDGDPDYFSIADAALSADFPLKNGDTNKLISICMRIKPESLGAEGSTNFLWQKYDTGGKRSLAILFMDSKITLALGYNNGDSFENTEHLSVLNVGTEYFITVMIDGINRTHFIHVFEIGGATVGSNIDSTFFQEHIEDELYVEDGIFALGALFVTGSPANYYDGIMDDVCVFNRLLDKGTTLSGEIADIRNEVFSAAVGAVPQAMFHYLHH